VRDILTDAAGYRARSGHGERHWRLRPKQRFGMNDLARLFAVPHRGYVSRREFLRRTGSGCGLVALASLLGEWAHSHAETTASGQSLSPLAPRPTHFPAKAQNVIWLFMNGGPSQVDTWQYKPELEKWDAKELPGFDKNTGFFIEQVGPLM